jgi:hypothetical protein
MMQISSKKGLVGFLHHDRFVVARNSSTTRQQYMLAFFDFLLQKKILGSPRKLEKR